MNVYELFNKELDNITIHADDSAVYTVGVLMRAVKRAQMVYDGQLPAVEDRDFNRG